MVQISTDSISSDPFGRRHSGVRAEIARLKKIETAEDKAFKAQKKMIEAVRDYGKSLAALLELGQSKTSVAKTFGMTNAKLSALIREAQDETQDAVQDDNSSAGSPVSESTDKEEDNYGDERDR